MVNKKRVVFTGGGTVGHITLNLLLIPKFIDDGWEVHYIGDKKGIEYQQICLSGLAVTFHSISTGKLRRYFSWQNFLDVFKVVWGIFQSLAIMVRLKPKALFSKGGFVSVPPVIAAKCLGVPVFIHESDLSMGLANKIAYRFATKMYTTFKQEGLAKEEHVGAITKIKEPSIVYEDERLLPIQNAFDATLPTLLFIGGSAGAKVFNDFISQTKELTESYNVINITGHSELNALEKNLYRVDYVTDLYQPLLALSDLVVTRGGANTIFELLALKKPHIIIPLGKAASRGDQLENAAYFEERGYAKTLSETDLTFERLSHLVNEVLANKDSYVTAMSQTKELTSLDDFYSFLQEELMKH